MTKLAAETKDPLDEYLGQRLRDARRDKGMTQPELARQIGVTFQQVQKYESAVNRISASRLGLAARALDKPVNWFFDGYRLKIN